MERGGQKVYALPFGAAGTSGISGNSVDHAHKRETAQVWQNKKRDDSARGGGELQLDRIAGEGRKGKKASGSISS